MASADKQNGTGFNTPAVVLCGVAAVIFLCALALFIQGGFLAAQANEIQAKIYDSPGNEEAASMMAEQQALLDEKVRWLDEEKGIAVMPIEDAMERIVNQNGK